MTRYCWNQWRSIMANLQIVNTNSVQSKTALSTDLDNYQWTKAGHVCKIIYWWMADWPWISVHIPAHNQPQLFITSISYHEGKIVVKRIDIWQWLSNFITSYRSDTFKVHKLITDVFMVTC